MDLQKVDVTDSDVSVVKKEILKIMKFFYWMILSSDVKNEIQNKVKDGLIDALMSGRIWYSDGAFRGHFDRKSSKRLRDMGARFKRNRWEILIEKVPPHILTTIQESESFNKIKTKELLESINRAKTPPVGPLLDAIYFRVIEKTNERINRTLQEVTLIKPQFDPTQQKNIKTKYLDNMELDIKKWSDEEVIRLRKIVLDKVERGIRFGDLKDTIEREFGVSDRKAQFLASQETRLLVNEMKEQKYRTAGINRYRWVVRRDTKVRDSHRALDGKIFDWDNPPVVDGRTGRRDHPGRDYNCRCSAVMIID